MSDSFSNNATPKYLGYVYQILIAIEQCFQAKPNETIWIECHGDVYDGNTSTEVKHHFKDPYLSDNSVDFWKTLKNLVVEDVSFFSSLILHTTATIPDKSLFYGWNDLTKTQKYKKLKDHRPTKSIQENFDLTITNYDRKDLLPILEKFTIKSSQLTIKDKWEELTKTRLFLSVSEQYKEDVLHWVYGYVNKQAINDRHRWQIKINDFDMACKIALQPYSQSRIPFPIFDSEGLDDSDKRFLFVEEMRKVKLRETPIEKAISDYLRARKSEIKLLENEPFTMSERLDAYDNTVLENLESLKSESAESIEIYNLDSDNSKNISRKLYHKSINSPHIEISGVNDTQKYYRNGRIHHNVNENQFIWDFCEDDLL